jgi:hypothetical protein
MAQPLYTFPFYFLAFNKVRGCSFFLSLFLSLSLCLSFLSSFYLVLLLIFTHLPFFVYTIPSFSTFIPFPTLPSPFYIVLS